MATHVAASIERQVLIFHFAGNYDRSDGVRVWQREQRHYRSSQWHTCSAPPTSAHSITLCASSAHVRRLPVHRCRTETMLSHETTHVSRRRFGQ
jgi:hypothetical protein